MPNYDGPLYAPYDVMLMGKLTRKQWQRERIIRIDKRNNESCHDDDGDNDDFDTR